MTEQLSDANVRVLCQWAIPIQERHFSDVNAASQQLAAAADAAAVAG